MRRKKVCFVGYGSTEYSRKSEESLLGQYATAIRAALNQTGLKKKDINGLSVTTQASPDTAPHVAEQLGFELDWVLNADYGGASGVGAVSRAADAIECGHLDIALLLAGNSFDRSVAHQRPLEYQRGNFVDVYGYGGPEFLDGADSAAAYGKLRHDPRADREDRRGPALQRDQQSAGAIP